MSTPVSLSPLASPLSQALIDEITTNRDLIQAAVNRLEDYFTKVDILKRQVQAANEKIVASESNSAPPSERGALNRVAQQEIVRVSIQRLNHLEDSSQNELGRLQDAMEPLSDLINRALAAEFNAYVGQIADAIRPYYHNSHDAVVAAKNSGAVGAFRSFIQRSFNWSPLDSGPRALAALNALLDGMNPFVFDPNAEA